MNYEKYAIIRDANTIAKFLAKVAAHKEKLAVYQMDNTAAFPRPIPKNAKYPAYEAAGRIKDTLGLDLYAHSVPDLAKVYAEAIAFINSPAFYADAPAV